MSGAASALFFLWSRSLANLVLGRLRRLKEPKYLFGAVLALAYIYFLFIYPTLVMDRPDDGARDEPERFATMMALAMLIFFALSWVWWRKRMALQLTDAEIAFLLPGPISHAALVHYHLVRGQAGMLVSATIFTLISQNWDSIASPLPMRFVGWWMLLASFYLYVSASGFTLTRLQDRGMAQWQRQLLALVLL
ncbi:MAG: putative ABC exporter domain-containing protein, partial [Burkholderiales bacterium]